MPKIEGKLTGVDVDGLGQDQLPPVDDEDVSLSLASDQDEDLSSEPIVELQYTSKVKFKSRVSNVESFCIQVPFSPQNVAKVDSIDQARLDSGSPRRYPTRNRTKVKRLDTSYSFELSYDKAMLQYMYMAQVFENKSRRCYPYTSEFKSLG